MRATLRLLGITHVCRSHQYVAFGATREIAYATISSRSPPRHVGNDSKVERYAPDAGGADCRQQLVFALLPSPVPWYGNAGQNIVHSPGQFNLGKSATLKAWSFDTTSRIFYDEGSFGLRLIY
ncbi:MAG TPA: hypothetical protein VNH18_31325 [Bryobacteraceae bacterium]|nr:hypothetical protein [Bryobacteraceae bacterium]